jgi:hypothetical protein
MNSKFALTRRRKLLLATVVTCTVLIAGLAMLWQGGKVSEAALVVPHPGLVGWWRFNETSGGVASDSSGNGNDGAVNGGATWVAGKYGNALSFDGTSGYVNVPDSSSLDFGSQITIEAWIYPGAVGSEMGIIAKHWTQYYLRLGLGAHAEGSVSIGGVGYRVYGTTTLSTGQWYYVVFTYDGQNMRIYVNGNLENTVALTGAIDTTTHSLTIGQIGSALQFFNGIIDEARIYSRALSATEIQANYQQSPDFSSVLAAVPRGTTDFIATLSWQGMGSINVTIQALGATYNETNATGVYQKTTYSVSGGTSTMLNIKRVEVGPFGALTSDQNWYIVLATSNVQDYKISVEVQR